PAVPRPAPLLHAAVHPARRRRLRRRGAGHLEPDGAAAAGHLLRRGGPGAAAPALPGDQDAAMLTEDEPVHFITGQETSEAAHWPALLDRMLLLSTGRPWREQAPGLTGATVEQIGESLRLDGQVGPLRVQVLARLSERGLALDLEWQNATAEAVTDLAVGLRLPGPAQARVTIPQVIYHDNPSADPDRTVPHVSRGGFVTE